MKYAWKYYERKTEEGYHDIGYELQDENGKPVTKEEYINLVKGRATPLQVTRRE